MLLDDMDEPKRLAGKVALLLVGGFDDHGRGLALDLALHGADIALIHAPSPSTSQQARKVQTLVQAEGQHCLLIAATPTTTASQMIQCVLLGLGRLDLFLDLTTESDAQYAPQTAVNQLTSQTTFILLATIRHLALSSTRS